MKLGNLKSILFLTVLLGTGSALAEQWGLILHKEGNGSGLVCLTYDGREDCQVDDSGNETNVYLDEYIYLRATPEPGSHFVEWAGGCVSKNRTCKWLTKKPHTNKPLTAVAIFRRGPGRVTAKPAKPASTSKPNSSPARKKPVAPAQSKVSPTKKAQPHKK